MLSQGAAAQPSKPEEARLLLLGFALLGLLGLSLLRSLLGLLSFLRHVALR
jgi:hypothetical protein